MVEVTTFTATGVPVMVVGEGFVSPHGKPVVRSLLIQGGPDITSNTLREIKWGQVLPLIRQGIGERSGVVPISKGALDLIVSERWLGRGYAQPEETYEALAEAYSAMSAVGERRPVEALAEAMGCSRATASCRISKARSLGYLTKPKVG